MLGYLVAACTGLTKLGDGLSMDALGPFAKAVSPLQYTRK